RRPGLAAALRQRLAEQHDLLAGERIAALAERHPRRPRVGPDAGEQARRGLEADEAEAGRLTVALAEGELRLQEPAAVDHRLPAGAGLLGGIPGPRVEGF